MSIYNLTLEDKNMNHVSFDIFKGKVLLIVNTATQCFFTKQYEALESLYQEFNSKGFEVLDFPCNQFGAQAPGDIKQIDDFCVREYKTSFLRFNKVDVNGPDEFILFSYLKQHQKSIGSKKIKWNFTKFLVDQKGKVIKRYSPFVKPEKIKRDIETLLEGRV